MDDGWKRSLKKKERKKKRERPRRRNNRMNTRRAEKGHRVENRLYNEQRPVPHYWLCVRACVSTQKPQPNLFQYSSDNDKWMFCCVYGANNGRPLGTRFCIEILNSIANVYASLQLKKRAMFAQIYRTDFTARSWINRGYLCNFMNVIQRSGFVSSETPKINLQQVPSFRHDCT